MKIFYSLVLIGLGSWLYRWIVLNHALQSPANRPRIFWNDTIAFVIYNTPFVFWGIGIFGLFMQSFGWGIAGIVIAILSWIFLSLKS